MTAPNADGAPLPPGTPLIRLRTELRGFGIAAALYAALLLVIAILTPDRDYEGWAIPAFFWLLLAVFGFWLRRRRPPAQAEPLSPTGAHPVGGPSSRFLLGWFALFVVLAVFLAALGDRSALVSPSGLAAGQAFAVWARCRQLRQDELADGHELVRAKTTRRDPNRSRLFALPIGR